MTTKKLSQDQIIKRLLKDQCTLQELGITLEDVINIKSLGYRVQNQQTSNGEVYYIVTEAENASLFISPKSKEAQTIKWVELSDIHAGSIQFDEQGLRSVLALAVKEGFQQVHISGDLCDGFKVYPAHQNNLRFHKADDQANLLASVLMEFPLYYIACKGNHDYSYEKQGGINPIKLVENTVNQANGQAKFTFLDSFAGDIVIAGMIKRMVHLDGGRAYAKSYPSQTYIRNLFDSHGENIPIGGKEYRIRFLQSGHFHTDIAFESAGIFITHSGNFQFPNDYTTRRGLVGEQGCRFTTVVVKNGQVLEYSSRFIKPIR